MTPQDFGQYLDGLRPSLKAYGRFVIGQIEDYLSKNLSPQEFQSLVKVGPSCRVKETASAIAKLEKKAYSDPVQQMTDVVGVRFVVLLQADLAWLERAVLNCSAWTARRDRAPLVEIAENPEVFEYKSIHFVVRLNEDIRVDDCLVPRDTPCEIQIRTLVQHAYAEFVHDRVYKRSDTVPPKVRRLVARAMAMLESTDETFSEASKELDAITDDLSEWEAKAEEIYRASFGVAAIATDADQILFYETYRHLLISANLDEVRRIFEKFASSAVQLREDENLFSRSFLVPIFWLLQKHDQELLRRWFLGKYKSDLETAAALCGISMSR